MVGHGIPIHYLKTDGAAVSFKTLSRFVPVVPDCTAHRNEAVEGAVPVWQPGGQYRNRRKMPANSESFDKNVLNLGAFRHVRPVTSILSSVPANSFQARISSLEADGVSPPYRGPARALELKIRPR